MELLKGPYTDECTPSELSFTALIEYAKALWQPYRAFKVSYSSSRDYDPASLEIEAVCIDDTRQVVISFPKGVYELYTTDGDEIVLPDTLVVVEATTSKRRGRSKSIGSDVATTVETAVSGILKTHWELLWGSDEDGPVACPFCGYRAWEDAPECEHHITTKVDTEPRWYPFNTENVPYSCINAPQVWTIEELTGAFGSVLPMILVAYTSRPQKDTL